LIKAKTGKNASRRDTATGAGDDDDEGEEESWTFIGGGPDVEADDLDPEAVLRRTVGDGLGPALGAPATGRALGSRVLGGLRGGATV
jgi:sterol 3beta-glucosyltransferase